ncbi:InlB B-repeat-containing protein [Parasphaerochaeta coccoides]|uniref:InlB B-repeat-containing protein n=1 Tax=Parasphaerochaeta coccoides TaxID=273376 RepID=UPI00345F8992
MTLYAQWEKNEYTVSFHANGATGIAPTSITDYVETTVTLPGHGTLEKSGYSFGGWNTELAGNGDSYAAGSSFEIPSQNVTLYAQWEKNQYTVSFNGNGSTGGSVPTSITDYVETTVTLPGHGTLEKSGYSFGGWNTELAGNGDSYAAGSSFEIPSQDVTLYAQWEKNQYTVSFNGNGSTGGSAPTSITDYVETAVTLPDCGTLEKSGYSFGGWNTDLAGNGDSYAAGSSFEIPSQNVTLYAQWEKNQYTVSFNGNGSTGGSAPTSITDYVETAVTLPGHGTLEKSGYSFGGWNTELAGNGDSYAAGSSFEIPSQNVTLYAQWEKNEYTITFDGNGHTGGTVPEPIIVNRGDEANVQGQGSLVKTNHVFAGWSTDPFGAGDSFWDSYFIPSDDMLLYAVWIRQYTVTFDGNGHTGGTVPAPITAFEGDEITVPGQGSLLRWEEGRDEGDPSGYRPFKGWINSYDGLLYGTGESDDEFFLMPPSDVILTADWVDF